MLCGIGGRLDFRQASQLLVDASAIRQVRHPMPDPNVLGGSLAKRPLDVAVGTRQQGNLNRALETSRPFHTQPRFPFGLHQAEYNSGTQGLFQVFEREPLFLDVAIAKSLHFPENLARRVEGNSLPQVF